MKQFSMLTFQVNVCLPQFQTELMKFIQCYNYSKSQLGRYSFRCSYFSPILYITASKRMDEVYNYSKLQFGRHSFQFWDLCDPVFDHFSSFYTGSPTNHDSTRTVAVVVYHLLKIDKEFFPFRVRIIWM